MSRIYLASSWRNHNQHRMVEILRADGHEVYDFKSPASFKGFHWSEIDDDWTAWSSADFVTALQDPIAERGFKLDFDAMKWAEVCVLLLPCGRSAHLEAGYFVGVGKPLFILLDNDEVIPELMYKMANKVCSDAQSLLEVLK